MRRRFWIMTASFTLALCMELLVFLVVVKVMNLLYPKHVSRYNIIWVK